MKEQLALQHLVHGKFEEFRLRNPLYSKRAFSKRLGLSAGALSEILSGQRKVSRNLAERIATALDLDPQERNRLLVLFPVRRRIKKTGLSTAEVIDADFLKLSADQFHLIGDWYHFAILALMRTQRFQSNAQWVSKRLKISVPTAEAAVDRLKRLGLIQIQSGSNQWVRSESRYRTSDDVVNLSIRKAHAQSLEKAQESLQNDGVKERDFTLMFLSMNSEQMNRAKEMIREFQDRLSNELETVPGREVYQLCVQLFPLSKTEGVVVK